MTFPHMEHETCKKYSEGKKLIRNLINCEFDFSKYEWGLQEPPFRGGPEEPPLVLSSSFGGKMKMIFFIIELMYLCEIMNLF